MSNSLYLKHYGVKGMKWGVRRASRKEAARQKAINRVRARMDITKKERAQMKRVFNDKKSSNNDKYTALMAVGVTNNQIARGKDRIKELKNMNLDKMSPRKIKKAQRAWEAKMDSSVYILPTGEKTQYSLTKADYKEIGRSK